MQASWDAPLIDLTYNQLLTRQTKLVDRARLLAVAAEHASDWLNAIPNPDLGLKLDNNSVRIACGLRLGSRLCQEHSCQCGKEVDQSGRHGLSCKGAEGRHPRHNECNQIIKEALSPRIRPYFSQKRT